MITSSIVKYSDFLTDDFKRIVGELGEEYKIHRKLWEFVRVVQVVEESGIELEGAKVLGFGVGNEPLAAWFAARGAHVLATDLVSDHWKGSNQNSQSKDQLRWRGICTADQFANNIEFANVNMNSIPRRLRRQQFDIVYSCGSLEHIGSKRHGLVFLINQLQCARSGGLAIHTTEYAYDSAGIDSKDLCSFSKDELIGIVRILHSGGRAIVRDIDWELGNHENDLFVDEEPYGVDPHIKMKISNMGNRGDITSICLVMDIKQEETIEVNENRKKHILWVGDAVTPTGFAKCTHEVCAGLVDEYDIDVLALNYFGDPHDLPYSVYPCYQPLDQGFDGFGVNRIDRLAKRLHPDAIMLLNDPWNIKGYTDALSEEVKDNCKLVAWLAVDGKNQNGQPLNELDHVIVWTQFAANELTIGGYDGPVSIVPLGVDSELFCPQDKAQCREQIGCQTANGEQVPDDAYVVGIVGRNQFPRKRLDLSVYYFTKWIKSHGVSTAYLLLHCAPTGDKGYDLISLGEYYNILDRLIITNITMGKVGQAYDELDVIKVYGAMDLYMTTTQGEGWGLPALEAMACGVPVIAPDWSGLGDWAKETAYLVPCTSIATSAPANALTYTIGGVAGKDEFVDGLHYLYRNHDYERTSKGTAGRELALKLSWDSTRKLFKQALGMVL